MRRDKPSVLVLQYRKNEEEQLFEQKAYKRLERELDISLSFIDAWDNNINWNNPERILGFFSAVILGGSAELFFEGKEKNGNSEDLFKVAYVNTSLLVKHLIKNDFPTLGICFGHQMLGANLGVSVTYDEAQTKAGTHLVTLTKDGKKDKLFSTVPDSFEAQYGHRDSLSEMPYEAVLMARGESCRYSAYRYKNNIYSVQFHPELNEIDSRTKARKYVSFLPKDANLDELIRKSPEASSLLRTFVKLYK